ncbi:hypothetical protein GCM10023225_06150 [Kineococcus glutinatus]|uniref:Uncharacterized protein n=1 Tax=Kineococcus glutinatus TaxID=1070872 RepID=A0ABP9HAL1_9ACTN
MARGAQADLEQRADVLVVLDHENSGHGLRPLLGPGPWRGPDPGSIGANGDALEVGRATGCRRAGAHRYAR